jgi:hypothetical protein
MSNIEQTRTGPTPINNFGPAPKDITLIDENKELWLQLCERAAAVERDPRKLHALVTEINRLLEERRSHPKQQRHEPAS